MDEAIAQFIAVTSCDADTARQYLEANDYELSSAVSLYFASNTGEDIPPANDGVRDRIEGFEDQIVDDVTQYYNDLARDNRRAEIRARKPYGVFNQSRDGSSQDLSRHEKRLATLFRPPFEIITDLSLENAKEEAQDEQKRLMVNVQDMGEFVCQRLNRDLFRNDDIKRLINKYFVFVQYDVDDPDGEEYKILYPFEEFPHIAIIDPWTGEQQRLWTSIPTHEQFIADVKEYLANNPQDVKRDDDFDDRNAVKGVEVVDLTNDDDRDFAPGSSTAPSSEPASSAPETAAETAAETSGNAGNASHVTPAAAPAAPASPLDNLPPLSEEPTGSDTTRIQFRNADGTRKIRRFNLDDSVLMLYSYVKSIVESKFTLTSGRDLSSECEKSIKEAGLQNSTILVELV